MAATVTKDHVALRLAMNKEKTQVLFAEARKDFVDVLYSFLTFPLGTIARLVSDDSESKPVRFGCLSSLYESAANLDEDCLTQHVCKQMLLRPWNTAEPHCRDLKLNIDHTEHPKFFMCGSCRNLEFLTSLYLSIFENIPCRRCGSPMVCEVQMRGQEIVVVGFVKSNATFIVTDGLHVIPNSLGASLTLLKNYGIRDTHSLHYRTVNVNKKKILKLLKCSLLSSRTLTHMFLSLTSHDSQLIFPICQPKLYCLNQGDANGGIQYIVKLIRSKSKGKILFAQGEEDFANFVLSFLSFPLGGVIRILEGSSGLASLDQLYNSIVDLRKDYFVSREARNMLIDSQSFLTAPVESKYYYHGHCLGDKRITSSNCLFPFGCVTLKFIDPKSHTENHNGFVKGPTMYLVSDNLSVTVMPFFSSILGNLEVPFGDLEENAVCFGVDEGLVC